MMRDEWMTITPEVFKGLNLGYGETQRTGDTVLSGNASTSDKLRLVYNWLRPAPDCSYEEWRQDQVSDAHHRIEQLYAQLSQAEQSLARVALSAPVHSTHLETATPQDATLRYDTPPDDRREADGLMTRDAQHGLLFNPGDCPIINIAYYKNRQVEAIAQIHAGAKGIKAEIARHALSGLADQHLHPKDAIAYMSPHAKSYTVYGSVKDELETSFSPYLHTTDDPDHKRFDMASALIDQMTECGVLADNIEVSSVDTMTNPRYFSQRRQSTVAGDYQTGPESTPPFGRTGIMFMKTK